MSRRLVDADALMHQLLTFPYYPTAHVTDDSNINTAIATAFREFNDHLADALHNAVVSDEEYIIVRVEQDK